MANIIHHITPNHLLLSCLQVWQKKYKLLVASNGNNTTQYAKLQNAGLLPYFAAENIYISGNMGAGKPSGLFYEQIIADQKIAPEQMLMIGDDPVNDIHAASQCGLKTCWVSHGRSCKHSIRPDFIINRLTDLEMLLKTTDLTPIEY